MKECKNCNATFEDKHDFCPYCGQKLTKKAIRKINVGSPELGPKEMPLTEKDTVICKYKNYLGRCLCLYIAFAPFYMFGGSFGFFWYLLIAFVLLNLYVLFVTGRETKEDLSNVNTTLVILIIIFFVMLFWGPLNPNYK